MAIIFIIPFSLQGQSISGLIVDAHDHPVKSALISLSFDTIYVASDELGHFILKKVSTTRQNLEVRCLGYKTKTIPVFADKHIQLKIALEDSSFHLKEFTIELERHHERLSNSTRHIAEVDEENIVANPGGNLMNSLQAVAGVNSINTGVGVGKPVIRGLSQNRVLVAESGIKQEGQQWGNDHGLEIDQYNIEEIAIIKGASTLEYGSDALGGVLMIPKPKHMAVGDFQHSLRSIYKSYNDLYGYMLRSKGNENGLIYRVNMSNQYYGDYKVPAEEFNYNRFILPIHNGQLKNTGGKELHYSLNLGSHFKKLYSEIKISGFNQNVGVFSGAVGIPRSNNLEDDNNSRNIELPNQDIRHEKYYWHNSFFTKNGGNLEFDLGWQRNTRREHSAPHSHGRPVDFSSDLAHEMLLNTYSLNAKFTSSEKKKLRNTIGYQSSYLNNEISGFEFIIPPYSQLNGGAYYIFNYSLSKKTKLLGGFRVDLSRFSVSASNLDFYYRRRYIETIQRNPEIDEIYSNYSGSLGFIRRIHEHWNVRFNLGKTFRIPNVAELSSNGVHHGAFRYERGDPDLNPESGYQYDIGIDRKNENLRFELSGFYNHFDNYIYLSPTGQFPTVTINDTTYPYPGPGQVYQYKQATVGHLGGEAVLNYQFLKNYMIGLVAEYVWIENLATKVPISFTPPPSIKMNLAYRPKNIFTENDYVNLEFAYKYYAEQNRVDQNEDITPEYEIADLIFGYSIKKENTLSLNFAIQNLFDQWYLNHLSRYRPLNIPEPGRNFVLSLKYEFNHSKASLK